MSYQFANFTLQVENAVKLSLATALRCDAVLAAPAHVVDELQLLGGQLVHFHHHLEIVAWKIRDLIDGERKLDL